MSSSSKPLLLHVCCGPCATATEQFWRSQGRSVVGFFFNPNIHPYQEFRRRLENVIALGQARQLEILVDETYDPAAWFRLTGIMEEGGDTRFPARCKGCIAMRLDQTARRAVQEGIEAFSTTLSISPWQNHDAIVQEGLAAAKRHGIEFLYRDLRHLYRDSVRQSKELGLYRQQYCGCILSEWERFRDARTLR